MKCWRYKMVANIWASDVLSIYKSQEPFSNCEFLNICCFFSFISVASCWVSSSREDTENSFVVTTLITWHPEDEDKKKAHINSTCYYWPDHYPASFFSNLWTILTSEASFGSGSQSYLAILGRSTTFKVSSKSSSDVVKRLGFVVWAHEKSMEEAVFFNLPIHLFLMFRQK